MIAFCIPRFLYSFIVIIVVDVYLFLCCSLKLLGFGFWLCFLFPQTTSFPFCFPSLLFFQQGGCRGVSVQPCAPSCWLGLNHNNFLLPFSSYLSSSHLFILFSSFILLFCFFLYPPTLSYPCFPYSVASLCVFCFFFHSYQYIFTCLQHS